MKFKSMYIEDIEARQKVMHIESDKELILYAETFVPSSDTNNEFVIGLPLVTKDKDLSSLESLASNLRESFSKFTKENLL
ncbi:MAG: hypothetical protein ACK5HS_05325 [Mycoplasmatales bacterium]